MLGASGSAAATGENRAGRLAGALGGAGLAAAGTGAGTGREGAIAFRASALISAIDRAMKGPSGRASGIGSGASTGGRAFTGTGFDTEALVGGGASSTASSWAWARKRARTFSATSSVMALECDALSLTPSSRRQSMIALLLTSSSRASSLIRIVPIYSLSYLLRVLLRDALLRSATFQLLFFAFSRSRRLWGSRLRFHCFRSILFGSALSLLRAAFRGRNLHARFSGTSRG